MKEKGKEKENSINSCEKSLEEKKKRRKKKEKDYNTSSMASVQNRNWLKENEISSTLEEVDCFCEESDDIVPL